jgi:hypothetical protein
MTGQYIGFHNQNFAGTASITVQVPDSGFSLKFGRVGSWASPPYDPFVEVVSFSGYSGYLFDQRGNMVGGYLKGDQFDLEFDVFYGSGQLNRMSYKINNVLIANNIPINSGDVFIDAVIFEDYGDQNNLFMPMKFETGSPTAIAGNTGLYLLADGFYLVGS